jgi:hypothetical protein
VKQDTEVSFYRNDPACFKKVPVTVFAHRPVSQSQATSIRVRVRANRELQPTNVTGHIMKIEKRTVDGEWSEIELPDYVQLTWAGTDTISVNFDDATAKYLNVLHIDRSDNKITKWQGTASLPVEFFDFKAGATYRLTISVMARQTRIEIDWEGQWDTIVVRPAA